MGGPVALLTPGVAGVETTGRCAVVRFSGALATLEATSKAS